MSAQETTSNEDQMTMHMPPAVSPQEWKATREELLVEEKELTHARDPLAAKGRRMPRTAVENGYQVDGPNGPACLLDFFDGRRQLIVAHKAVDERLTDRSQLAVLGSLGDQRLREIVDSYVDAFERADVEMLAADGAFTMPPPPIWYRWREAVAAFLNGHVLASGDR